MPDQPVIAGIRTRRACQVVIDNSLDRVPTVTFMVEDMVRLDDGSVFRQGAPSVQVQYAQGATIALVDPATDQPTGEVITHDHLYQALYSLFRAQA